MAELEDLEFRIGELERKVASLSAGGRTRVSPDQAGGVFTNPITSSNRMFRSSVRLGSVAAGGGRIRFEDAASATLWEIDNTAGDFRIFTPGVVKLNIDPTGEIFLFGASASLARLRLRGFYTASPSNPAADQTDLIVVDNGVSPVFRVRYNDAGVMKVGDLALV